MAATSQPQKFILTFNLIFGTKIVNIFSLSFQQGDTIADVAHALHLLGVREQSYPIKFPPDSEELIRGSENYNIQVSSPDILKSIPYNGAERLNFYTNRQNRLEKKLAEIVLEYEQKIARIQAKREAEPYDISQPIFYDVNANTNTIMFIQAYETNDLAKMHLAFFGNRLDVWAEREQDKIPHSVREEYLIKAIEDGRTEMIELISDPKNDLYDVIPLTEVASKIRQKPRIEANDAEKQFQNSYDRFRKSLSNVFNSNQKHLVERFEKVIDNMIATKQYLDIEGSNIEGSNITAYDENTGTDTVFYGITLLPGMITLYEKIKQFMQMSTLERLMIDWIEMIKPNVKPSYSEKILGYISGDIPIVEDPGLEFVVDVARLRKYTSKDYPFIIDEKKIHLDHFRQILERSIVHNDPFISNDAFWGEMELEYLIDPNNRISPLVTAYKQLRYGLALYPREIQDLVLKIFEDWTLWALSKNEPEKLAIFKKNLAQNTHPL